ncbi:hypothetical protein [Spiroplasma endosymbiont of Aspidapion aeneum]|uniref:hypothetical protein n=1 Tax=Spiroplasma endosymbiont of Aspidapion aeneum TaxID=3066276 RepID=UPI00313BF54C
MNLKKIHHLSLAQANPLEYFKRSNLLEEELLFDEEFLYRVSNTRFFVPLKKMSYKEISGSTGEAIPLLLFKPDFTPFFTFYSTITKAFNIVKTEGVGSNDYFSDLLYRDMCALDIINLLEDNDIREADIDADKWTVSPLHLKKPRAKSWKSALTSIKYKISQEEKTVDAKIDDTLEQAITIIKSKKFITNIYLEQIEISKFKKYKFYLSSVEDPYILFNEYAILLETINDLFNNDIFIEFICIFEKDIKNLVFDNVLQVSAAIKN